MFAERVSLALSTTVTALYAQPLRALAPVVGGWRSILRPPSIPTPRLPTWSATVAEAERAAPSPVTVVLAGQGEARPEPCSRQLQATTTSPVCEPAAFGAVVVAPVRTGAVRSIRKAVGAAGVSTLPARSAERTRTR